MATLKRVNVTLTPTITAGTYAVGEVIGGLLTLPPVFDSKPGSGVLDQLMIYDADKQQAPMKALFLSAVPSASLTDGDSLDMSDADSMLVKTIVPITSHVSYADNDTGFSFADQLGKRVYSTEQELFLYLVCDGTLTYSATDSLVIEATVLLDT